jgi:hypothetical protein
VGKPGGSTAAVHNPGQRFYEGGKAGQRPGNGGKDNKALGETGKGKRKLKEPTEQEKAEKDWLAQIGLGIFCGIMKNPTLKGRGIFVLR